MGCREIQRMVREMSASVMAAQGHLSRLLEMEARGWGDNAQALIRIARDARISRWTLERIRTGSVKSVRDDVKARLRTAYIEACERQLSRLQHDLDIEKAMQPDDVFEDFDAEIAALAAKIQARKARKGVVK